LYANLIDLKIYVKISCSNEAVLLYEKSHVIKMRKIFLGVLYLSINGPGITYVPLPCHLGHCATLLSH
jgi:hypothetical protein